MRAEKEDSRRSQVCSPSNVTVILQVLFLNTFSVDPQRSKPLAISFFGRDTISILHLLSELITYYPFHLGTRYRFSFRMTPPLRITKLLGPFPSWESFQANCALLVRGREGKEACNKCYYPGDSYVQWIQKAVCDVIVLVKHYYLAKFKIVKSLVE